MMPEELLASSVNASLPARSLNYTVAVMSPGQSPQLYGAMWIFLCISITALGLAVASFKYLRDQYHRPENKRRRKEKAEMEMKAKEERAVAAVTRDPIPAGRFLQVLRQKKSEKQLNIEVRAIVRNQEEFPFSAAQSPVNASLNVKHEVVTYDHSRVILWDAPEGYHTDYINASFIDGYYITREYIASQGPTNRTLAAFWHMIWQEGVHCIVMATGLFTNAAQCEKYWDDFLCDCKYVRHGDVHIWNEESVYMAQLNVRTFRIQKDGCPEQRTLRQFEMVGFHDNECADPGLLLDVRRRVTSYMTTTTGPILVHCRCGGGRTAVYLALDYCLKQLEAEDRVDVYSAVLHLRRFRRNMIRTLCQYRIVYDAIAMHIQCGTTVFPAALLPAAYHKFYSKSGDHRQHRIEHEFHMLQAVVPRLTIGDCASGHRVENRSKSRDIMILPPERARPYLLTSDSGDSSTDFINAVYVDGYHQANLFLITQWPKRNTVNDLWRLLMDYKITTLVVLHDVKISRNCPRFWPRDLDEEHRYGPINVKYVGCGKYNHLIIRAFTIRKNGGGSEQREEQMIVKMFQTTGGRHKGPICPKSLKYILQCSLDWHEKTGATNPICVMSKDGAACSGIFCSVSLCCDQLKTDKEIDVFNAVRLVKRNRPQLVPNLDEYRFIYTYMVDHVSSMDTKPQIVVTGAEGDNTTPSRRMRHPPPSAKSSYSGSFQTAEGEEGGEARAPRPRVPSSPLTRGLDRVAPNSITCAQAQSLSACLSHVSPHIVGRLQLADHFSFSSIESLSNFDTATESSPQHCSVRRQRSLYSSEDCFSLENSNVTQPRGRRSPVESYFSEVSSAFSYDGSPSSYG